MPFPIPLSNTRPLQRALAPIFTALLILLAQIAPAGIHHHEHPHGDHFAYIPEATPAKAVLVLAHGMAGKTEAPDRPAKTFLDRWIPFADTHGLILIAPVFDTDRFGNLGGGYGGYRGLFGKYIPADRFVLTLVEFYQRRYTLPQGPFLLYGHSAGAQFALRFTLKHPQTVIHTVLSAPGRYTYPDLTARWPYGAGLFRRQITWKDGKQQHALFWPKFENFAKASTKFTVVVGADDTRQQPKRPAHIGTNRVEFARSWVRAMGNLDEATDAPDLRIIPDIGHDSRRLTPHAQRALIPALP